MVLVIVSLISGIVLFAFQRVLDTRLRLAQFLDGSDTPVLIESWFRDSIDGLVPDAKGGADVFVGQPRRLTGLSVAPLNGMAGTPTRITWEIAYDGGAGRTYLRYQDSSAQVLTVASWPDDRGNFRFCGPDLACYETWPPADKMTEVPSLILLNILKGTEDWAILAAPRADRDPPPPPPTLVKKP